MIVLVPMVMAAAAGVAMPMMMVVVVMTMGMVLLVSMVGMIMGVIVPVRMVVMVVRVIVAVMVMPMVVIADMNAALRLEGALHGGCGAALSPRQFGERRIVLDVESVACDLDEAVLAAQVPRQAHEAQRVLGPDLKQLLGSRLHLNEASILEPQGVAVVDGRLHVEIQQDLGSALPFQRPVAAVSRLMIEGHRVDDTVGLHGGLADDGGDAGHGFVSTRGLSWSSVAGEKRAPPRDQPFATD
jgi:hypothetical protein